MTLQVTVPQGFGVASSGGREGIPSSNGDSVVQYEFADASFPGSFAVMKGDPKAESAGGFSTTMFFRDSSKMASAYGQEIGKAMDYFTGLFGNAPSRKITVVETEAGAPNGYASPGMIFLSPNGIGSQVNVRVIANQVARQWWGNLISPASRNNLWIQNGHGALCGDSVLGGKRRQGIA